MWFANISWNLAKSNFGKEVDDAAELELFMVKYKIASSNSYPLT